MLFRNGGALVSPRPSRQPNFRWNVLLQIEREAVKHNLFFTLPFSRRQTVNSQSIAHQLRPRHPLSMLGRREAQVEDHVMWLSVNNRPEQSVRKPSFAFNFIAIASLN
ncbi:hypothetical protein Agabi119p4_2096 [Agaricus bisporus var. burnettii]|uniref:Uncharacterized protein n=1 Tax=Agaricus bisporus var. burnettii TaxID=192524 RepID=A0A8H7F8G5_AGABI|nr:hypothetical protein Agabi119p4_2096 [Agaricus bisporus var. burnettii]